MKKIMTNPKKSAKLKNLEIRKEKADATKIVKLLKRYSLKQWLQLIISSNRNNSNSLINKSNLNLKDEFLVCYTDLAIRISMNQDNTLEPTKEELAKLLNTETNLVKNQSELVNKFGISSVSFVASWQNRFNYERGNILGRLTTLYNSFNEDFKKDTGLNISDLYLILLTIYGLYKISDKYAYFKKESLFKYASLHDEFKNLSLEKVTKFLELFSITQEEYIKKAQRDKIDEKSFGKFKYLVRYPIIEVEDDLYIVPVMEQLIDTISNNLYFLLLENAAKKNKTKDREVSKAFMEKFGHVLEKYVLELGKEKFGFNAFTKAEDIIKKENERKCEGFFNYKDYSLAIEVKKMNFRRDAITQIDKEHIDGLIDRHIISAFEQIENTFNYINKSNKFGLIIIPDILIGLETISEYAKNELEENSKYTARFDENIFLCTLSWYEDLISNEPDTIFKILQATKDRDIVQGKDIIMVMIELHNNGDSEIVFENEYLYKKRKDILKENRIVKD